MSSNRGKGDRDDQLGKQRSGDPGEDKVIHLPRDWLGPREDLVPFGPSADRQGQEPRESSSEVRDASRDEVSARPPLEEVPPPPLDPVSPDDFWGERSAALQGPLAEDDREAAVEDTSEPTLRRRRAPVLAAGAAAAVAIVILSVSLLGQSSSGPERSGGSAGVDSGGGRGTLWPLPAHTPLALHRAGRSVHGSKRKEPTVPRRGATVTVNYVRQSSASRSATGGGGGVHGTGSDSTPSPNANPSPQTASSPPTSSGTAPTSPTSSANPSTASGNSRHKPPAFGPDGALGPGHSGTG